MDPISIAAFVIGILGVADQCVDGLERLRKVRQAPVEYLALINEIADLQVVLAQIIAFDRQRQWPPSDGSVIALRAQLRRAEDQLVKLNDLVHRELKKPEGVNRIRWAFNRDSVASQQQGLRTTRSNLANAIGLVNR